MSSPEETVMELAKAFRTEMAIFAQATLVDCEIVARRKQEILSLSPAQLTAAFGQLVFDESYEKVPLKEFVRPIGELNPNPPSTRLPMINNNRGGRKKLPICEQKSYLIGQTVDSFKSRLECAIKMKNELRKSSHSQEDIISTLQRLRYTTSEIKAALDTKTALAAAKQLAVFHLSKNSGEPLSLATIRSCYSRYLRIKKLDP